MERIYSVYMLASGRCGTLYVGVTSDLPKRVWQHRQGEANGFTKRYGVNQLVWYTTFGDVRDAIDFEKRLKKWRRAWKIRRIEKSNPEWDDLYLTINQ